MTTYPVEQFRKGRLKERLQYAMIEALFRQGFLTDAQRRELRSILKCESAAVPVKGGFGEKNDR